MTDNKDSTQKKTPFGSTSLFLNFVSALKDNKNQGSPSDFLVIFNYDQNMIDKRFTSEDFRIRTKEIEVQFNLVSDRTMEEVILFYGSREEPEHQAFLNRISARTHWAERSMGWLQVNAETFEECFGQNHNRAAPPTSPAKQYPAAD